MINFDLNKINLFKDINKNQVELLIKDITTYTKSYNKGQYIAFKGETVDKYMIITKGIVVTQMTKQNGQIIQIETLYPYQEIAPSFLFGFKNFFPVDIIAKEEVEIFFIPKNSFLDLLQKELVILKNALDIFSNRTQFLSNKLYFSNKTIDEKLAIYILENTNNDIFILNKSIKDLAEIFGIARPSLSRIISSWINDGILIKTNKNQFKIKKSILLDKI